MTPELYFQLVSLFLGGVSAAAFALGCSLMAGAR